MYRLQMIVEELFINTITHGHGGNSANAVHLELSCRSNRITLRYRDSAPAFDTSRAISHIPVENRVGGLGIALINGMSKAVRYQRSGADNIVEIDF